MVTQWKPTPSYAHPAFDVYAQDCPTRMVLNRIGDKWALLILDCLRDGSARFSVIRKKIGGISQKVLSQVLKNLERDGLVLRTVHATVPVAVEYSLTSLGETLTQAVASLTHWAEQHMDEVQEAQLRYDGKRTDG